MLEAGQRRSAELRRMDASVASSRADGKFLERVFSGTLSHLQDELKYAREAFDKFFQHYPYCYGYWRKYAEMERKHGELDKCNRVSMCIHALFV